MNISSLFSTRSGLPGRIARGGMIAALFCAVAASGAVNPVAFDWFSYKGEDGAAPAKLAPDEYKNPILAGFYPDPSICRAGDDYYLINSTFAYFPGIPVFHSRDLVNWEQVGNVISRPEQLPYKGLGVSRGIFAPAISHHDGKFYVVCTMVDAGGNFVCTADNPAGPWSDPTWLTFEGIDPSLFFDDDGRAWLINNGAPQGTPLYDGHRAIWIQEFDFAARKMIGPRKVLVNGGVDIRQKPVWIEGPHIFKREGWYYLSCAEGGTGPNHSQVVFRSRQVDGPYTPWSGNPILTQRDLPNTDPTAVTSTGHADLLIGPDNRWWSVFLGVRPYEGRFSPTGRETFLLPVTWTEDGWPRILEAGKRVPLVGKAPEGAAYRPSALKLNGVGEWRDDFTEAKLSPLWIMLRAPSAPWWKIDAAKGQLELTPRGETLSGTGNPSYLARRVQHARFAAATAVEVPADAAASAGLVVFQGERFNYFLGVKKSEEGAVVFVEKAGGGRPEIVASTRIHDANTVALKVDAAEAVCRFSFSEGDRGDRWTTLLNKADAKILTTEVAGGFVGATVGVYARLDPSSNQGK